MVDDGDCATDRGNPFRRGVRVHSGVFAYGARLANRADERQYRRTFRGGVTRPLDGKQGRFLRLCKLRA